MAKIDVNQFTLERIDIETFEYPRARVATWSSLDGPGGSVALEAGDGIERIVLARIDIKRDGSVKDERAELQELADEFNEDPRASWDRLIGDALSKSAAYYARQIEECTTRLAAVQTKLAAFEASKSLNA